MGHPLSWCCMDGPAPQPLCVQASLRSLQASSPGGRKPSVALNAGLEGLLHPPPSLGGIVSHPRKEREDGAPSLVVLHGWASPLLPAPTALALLARLPTNWPAASLRSLQASSPGRHKPSVALNAGLEGLLHPPPSLGGIVSHPRKEREDGAPSLVVLHGWASPLLPAPTALALLARLPTNWPAASLRSLQASSPGRHKPSVALNAGLEGLLHPPPSLGGIVSHPRKEREDGAPSLVVLHGWASPLLPAPTALALLARLPTNWPAASLRSLQASSPGRHKPSVALNAGLEGLLHPPPSLGGIVSHPRKEREDGAPSLVVLHGWASPLLPAPTALALLARLPTNWPAASLRSLQASSPGRHKPSVALNAGLEGLLHPPPSLGGIVSHPRKEREDGAPSLVVLHGWASPLRRCRCLQDSSLGEFSRPEGQRQRARAPALHGLAPRCAWLDSRGGCPHMRFGDSTGACCLCGGFGRLRLLVFLRFFRSRGRCGRRGRLWSRRRLPERLRLKRRWRAGRRRGLRRRLVEFCRGLRRGGLRFLCWRPCGV